MLISHSGSRRDLWMEAQCPLLHDGATQECTFSFNLSPVHIDKQPVISVSFGCCKKLQMKRWLDMFIYNTYTFFHWIFSLWHQIVYQFVGSQTLEICCYYLPTNLPEFCDLSQSSPRWHFHVNKKLYSQKKQQNSTTESKYLLLYSVFQLDARQPKFGLGQTARWPLRSAF